MIEEITIKFGTKLKPTQHSWKSQLYRIVLRQHFVIGLMFGLSNSFCMCVLSWIAKGGDF